MKIISIIGAGVVTLALLSYSIAIITEQRKTIITKKILTFLSIGVFLDITATICMIIGSQNTPFTFHGFIGYSALVAMIIDMSLIWKSYFKNGLNSIVNKGLHRYSLIAYIWWVVVYITGSLLIAIK